jgi:hypothetical protein
MFVLCDLVSLKNDLERVLNAAFSLWLQLLLNVCSGFASRVRAWSLQGSVHTSPASAVCTWQ